MGEEIKLTAADGGQFAVYLALPARLPAGAGRAAGSIQYQRAHPLVGRLRRDGFIALAPDVFWRQEPGATIAIPTKGAPSSALRAALDTDQFARDLDDMWRVARNASGLHRQGRRDGLLSRRQIHLPFGTSPPVDAAVSYYGVHIDEHLDEAGSRGCPLLMQFAATIRTCPRPRWRRFRHDGREEGVEIHVYPGTEHGFNRQGYPPFNEDAAREARRRTVALLRDCLA